MESSVRVTLNGEQKEVPGPLSVRSSSITSVSRRNTSRLSSIGLVTGSQHARDESRPMATFSKSYFGWRWVGLAYPSHRSNRYAFLPQPALCRHGQVYNAPPDA